MTLPRSSLDHPGASKVAISAWQLLIWAYYHENVRARGGFLSLQNTFSLGGGTSRVIDALDNGDHVATVRGYLQSHADAVAVDNFIVKETSGIDANGKKVLNFPLYYAIAKAGETRTPVPAELDLPTQRCVPVMVKRCGLMVPKMIYPAKGRKEPIACCVDIVGVPAKEIAAAQRLQRKRHAFFLALLDVMEARLQLGRWVIEGRGLTAGGESLTQGVILSALRPEA